MTHQSRPEGPSLRRSWPGGRATAWKATVSRLCFTADLYPPSHARRTRVLQVQGPKPEGIIQDL